MLRSNAPNWSQNCHSIGWLLHPVCLSEGRMPKCVICGSETKLLVHGELICIACDNQRVSEERLKQTLAGGVSHDQGRLSDSDQEIKDRLRHIVTACAGLRLSPEKIDE